MAVQGPIGIFDSGAGGLSVLYEAFKALPLEHFIYYGDSASAPYGDKTEEEIRRLTLLAAEKLMDDGIKALVVACNTATSAAIEALRAHLPIPVVGMEPAIKMATRACPSKSIVILGTAATLRQSKLRQLLFHIPHTQKIILLPCKGLVEIIEAGAVQADIEAYLKDLVSEEIRRETGAVVLGCTHYVLAKDCIQAFWGEETALFDGNAGTVRRLASLLEEQKIAAAQKPQGQRVVFKTSGTEECLIHYRQVFNKLLTSSGPNDTIYGVTQ